MNMTKLFFLFIMMLSTMITISSMNWLGMWVGLEINLMTYIPFISKSKNKASSKAMMIYFLTQSIGSILMLFSILMNFMLYMSPLYIENLITMMVMVSVLIKLGAAPFHLWLPEMMSNLNWTECMILMTWQKLAPLTILNNLISNNLFTYLVIILSATFGAVGGLNQASLRKILGYSSINHVSWMMMFMSMSLMWYKYLLIYWILVVMICLFFNSKNSFFINQINSMSYSLMEKYMYLMLMLSLGGLPPFLGFLPKWMVIQSMIQSNLYLLMLLLLLMSLITLFYYMRLMSPLILNYSMINKWNNYDSPNKWFLYMIFFINMSLPLFSVLSIF
uniref:NADH-ubiquinone oxidoreductase chain 2 n=1 Tax=Myrmus lateralis TaxID=2717128 RepID=A0A6G8QTF2_9HEMI|nr:NADH dehydrogenase subunit 2 [Myrmus lateralis]QIN90637.1 NADH dehydrogenase subunit 2 [Myrmus lateralis]